MIWGFSKVPIYPHGQSAASRTSRAPVPSLIQPKLAIGEVNDPSEHEADHVAEQVMRMPEPRLQRKCACGGTCSKCSQEHSDGEREPIRMKRIGPASPTLAEAPPIVHQVLRSPGQPLDSATRGFMEPRFGHDFSRIRIHTDATAGESAKAIHALAYTSGNGIVFAPGQYQPHSRTGGQLLAHELAHTLHQGGVVRRQPAATEEKPEHAFVADKRMRTWRRYARSEAQKDAARIRKAGKVSSEDRQLVDAKLAFFEGEAKDIYIKEIRPVLSQFVERPPIEMPEKYVGRLSSKERKQLEHRRYLTTVYFERKEYEFEVKDAYEKGLQSLLEGSATLDYDTMEEIVQQRYPNAPWHVKARQEFLAQRQEREQQQAAKLHAVEQVQEHQKLLPQLPEYWQNQIGALSEQIQSWPEDAQLLAKGLLWKWYDLRKQANPANPALALPGIEGGIETTIRKELLADFESVLRAADRNIQRECAKNPPGWMERIHGNPCISLFVPFGRAESALNHLERRLKIFRDEDGTPYRTVFFWVEEYQKQQVPTSMAGRFLELLQARAMLGRALSMAVSPSPISGMRPPPTAGVAGALGEAETALGPSARPGLSAPTVVEPVSPSAVGKNAPGITFPRTNLVQGGFSPPEIEPPPAAPPPAPVPARPAPAGPPSGLGNWLRSKVLEYTMRGVDASEVAPGIGPGGGQGNRPVPAEVGGATPSSTPTPEPVVPSRPATQPGSTPIDPQPSGPSTPGGPSSPPSGSSSPTPSPSGSSSPSPTPPGSTIRATPPGSTIPNPTPSGSTIQNPAPSSSTISNPTPSGTTAPRNLSGSTQSIPSPSIPSLPTLQPSALPRSRTVPTLPPSFYTPTRQPRVLVARDYIVQPITEGRNQGKLMLTHRATGQRFLFKPRSGELPLIGENVGIVAGERFRRAPAAAYLARLAGIQSPSAEIVIWRQNGRDEIGSLQQWVTEGQPALSLYYQPIFGSIERSQPKLDLNAFDYVIANMDRNVGNWRVVLDPTTQAVQRVIPIDMDTSLPPGPVRYSQGHVMNPHQPALPPTVSKGLYDRLLEISANRTAIGKDLAEFLPPSEIQGVFTRLDQVLQDIQQGHIRVIP